MPPKKTLSASDREFFSLVADAAFSNPFSDRREELDSRIAGIEPVPGRITPLEDVRAAVLARMDTLRARGVDSLRHFGGEDLRVMRMAFLFDVFHRFIEPFDQLIVTQARQGAEPCPVPFAPDALGMLRARGFPDQLASAYFSTFYQLRRAFYFIDHGLVGTSPCMRDLRRRLWNNVFTSEILFYDRYFRERMEDFSTLLLGETGTGKGTAAAAIGRSGFIPFDGHRQRFACSFTDAFISINLSQFPEALIESELFGHRKGAFTGAVEHHEGILARCSPHGSIFLDEIGEVPTHLQIKLLQVLQERTFSPVGSHESIRFEGRVIAATNRPIDKLRSDGTFRDDFFYRLCSDVITVPTLRRRIQEDPGELEALLDGIVQRLAGQPAPELRTSVREALRRQPGGDYSWPGNVRELEQAVRRILLTSAYQGDREGIDTDLADRLAQGLQEGSLSAEELLAGYCRLLHERYGTYEEVARRTLLDRRTAKKHVHAGS
jgi:DNA-binding NtrC family response regulator